MVESMRNLHIVLFIGVMCVLQTLAQVCPYSDPGCTCDEDRIRCSNLQQIPPLNTGVNVTRITQLSFEAGNIATISNNSLPPGLTSINLLNNPFTDISDDAFDTSAATLKSVVIRQAKLNNLPLALKKLTTLTNLSIVYTAIQDWDSATLAQIAATLENLELKAVGLSSWPSWISDFQLLRSIDLNMNSLEFIDDDAFISIKDSLTNLDLSSTGLTQVPDALSVLSFLETLSLSNNNIANVSEIEKITRFPFAEKLSNLYLDSTGLTTTANLSNLTSLRLLNLDDNRISDVPAGSLPGSLTSLLLGQNRLASVPQDIASMSQLSVLHLSNNLITGIEPNTFPSSLTDLDLSYTHIAIISNSTLRNLNLLRTLGMDGNNISISSSAFSDLTSLRTLSLIYSNLTEIPLAFAQLSPHIVIFFVPTQPPSCPCPAPKQLVQWFSSLHNNYLRTVICSNGQSVAAYLSGQCGPPTATA